jgi:hypothetical protein
MNPLLVVIYRKRTNGKFYLSTFNNTHVDEILNSRKKKPLLPYSYEIEAIGVGSNFVDIFKKKYNLK